MLARRVHSTDSTGGATDSNGGATYISGTNGYAYEDLNTTSNGYFDSNVGAVHGYAYENLNANPNSYFDSYGSAVYSYAYEDLSTANSDTNAHTYTGSHCRTYGGRKPDNVGNSPHALDLRSVGCRVPSAAIAPPSKIFSVLEAASPLFLHREARQHPSLLRKRFLGRHSKHRRMQRAELYMNDKMKSLTLS